MLEGGSTVIVIVLSPQWITRSFHQVYIYIYTFRNLNLDSYHLIRSSVCSYRYKLFFFSIKFYNNNSVTSGNHESIVSQSQGNIAFLSPSLKNRTKKQNK